VDGYDERSVTDLSRAVRSVVMSHYEPLITDADEVPEKHIEEDSPGRLV
jgi:hypothetical protein